MEGPESEGGDQDVKESITAEEEKKRRAERRDAIFFGSYDANPVSQDIGPRDADSKLTLNESRTLDMVREYVESRKDELDGEEIVRFVREHPDLGLASMALGVWWQKRMEDTADQNIPFFQRRGMASLIIFCMFITWLAQVILPTSIFVISFYKYNEVIADLHEEAKAANNTQGLEIPQSHYFCPTYVKSPEMPTRLIMACISLIYLARIVLMAIKKGNDALYPDKGKSRPTFKTSSGKELRICVELIPAMRIDRYMDVVYEPVTLCINLIMVFFTDSAVEMVLNAIAMEFINKLDEELQETFFALLQEESAEEDFCISFYEQKQTDPAKAPIDTTPDISLDQLATETQKHQEEFTKSVDKWLNMLCFVVLIGAVLLSAFFMVYAPICKPGELGIM